MRVMQNGFHIPMWSVFARFAAGSEISRSLAYCDALICYKLLAKNYFGQRKEIVVLSCSLIFCMKSAIDLLTVLTTGKLMGASAIKISSYCVIYCYLAKTCWYRFLNFVSFFSP